MSDIDRSERPIPCCREAENMRRETVDEQRYIEHCACGRRHFVMVVDPIEFGVEGKEI